MRPAGACASGRFGRRVARPGQIAHCLVAAIGNPHRLSARRPATAWPSPQHRAGWSSHARRASWGSETALPRCTCGRGSRSPAGGRSPSAPPRSRTSACDTWPPAWQPTCASPPRSYPPRRDSAPRLSGLPPQRQPHCVNFAVSMPNESFAMMPHDSPSLCEALPGPSGQPSNAHRGCVASSRKGHTV